VVIEVLEAVRADSESLEAIEALRARGHQIAAR